MNAEQGIARVWLLSISMVAIWAAVLLSVAPGPGSGEQAHIERRVEVTVSQRATDTPDREP